MNDLRGRIVVQTDGQLKTGRDVVIAACWAPRSSASPPPPLVAAGLHHDARVPPEHLPGRHRHAGPGAAQEVRRQARARRQLLLLRRRGAARDHGRSSASARSTRWSAASTCSTSRDAIEHWKATGPRPLADPAHGPRSRRTIGTYCATPQDHGLDEALDNELIELAAPALERGERGRDRAADPQRQPHGRHDAVERDRAHATARTACPTTRSSINLQRLGRPELRRLRLANGVDGPRRGRRQRLLRQGPVRRPNGHRLAAARGAPSCPRRTSSSATSRLRRHQRRGLPPRHGRRALLRAQQRRHGGGRGRRRPRLRVHDRRPWS